MMVKLFSVLPSINSSSIQKSPLCCLLFSKLLFLNKWICFLFKKKKKELKRCWKSEKYGFLQDIPIPTPKAATPNGLWILPDSVWGLGAHTIRQALKKKRGRREVAQGTAHNWRDLLQYLFNMTEPENKGQRIYFRSGEAEDLPCQPDIKYCLKPFTADTFSIFYVLILVLKIRALYKCFWQLVNKN